ncbi:putative 3-oxo-5-alpha-steroid 4-dehydrogenase [Paratrimastix pyriformis]|uniref:3-oxo-5-alpha-steroid 4-dehydrogenase n=1 Tax=Paratrimastix pyriformis TaxID=342808 RepID=A0ABQ8UIW7_9EUKA|nr:putative 3-oxo-5-alpha-steroid 4-dehydrogenase [Paratrimastix pyriformis]
MFGLEDETMMGIWALIAGCVMVTLLFIPAPYGRHASKAWGKGYDSRWSFFFMEIPAFLIMGIRFLLSEHKTAVSTVFCLLFELHYFRRTFIYPFTLKGSATYPIAVSLMAIVFNFCNGYFLTQYLTGANVESYPVTWLVSPQFLIGLCLFLGGMAGNRWADHVMANLRKPGETGYKIPYGGLFRWISCPNYACEMVEWLGFCLLTCTPPAWVFLAWTIANLAPRAVSHHKWYKATFPEYPKNRKAFIPYLL